MDLTLSILCMMTRLVSSAVPTIPLHWMDTKEMIFDTKAIGWKGDECTILIQNENGPCPLIALVNVLVLGNWASPLTSRSVRAYTSGKDKIDLATILGLLAELIIEAMEAGAKDGDKQNESELHPTSEALTYLPRLETGLNVDLKFDGTFVGPELSLFNIFNVQTLHGWICDTQSPEWPILKTVGTYDRSQEILLNAREGRETNINEDVVSAMDVVEPAKSSDAGAQPSGVASREANSGEEGPTDTHGETGESPTDLPNEETQNPMKEKFDQTQAVAVIFNFMSTYPTQLTPYGLSHMLQAIPDNDGGLAVVFRNNHFSTLCKYKGTLYTLVTDLGLKDTKNVVWQSLTSISGNSDNFYDSNFEIPDLSKVKEKEDADRIRAKERQEMHNQDLLLAQQLQQLENEKEATRSNRQRDREVGRSSREPSRGNSVSQGTNSNNLRETRKPQPRQTTIQGGAERAQKHRSSPGARSRPKDTSKEKCVTM